MRYFTCLILVVAATVVAQPAAADVTPEQKMKLSELSKELRNGTTMLRRKEVDEVKTLIEATESAIAEMELAEDESDRTYRSLMQSLTRLKAQIPVSFESEVAPIIKQQCAGCHGATRASGMLRLNTFNGMAQGGQTGPLLQPRNPRNSHIMARLTTPDTMYRMPKNRDALPPEEIDIIGRWISQGAMFDGENRDAEIGAAPPAPPKPPVKVVMADGTESVSFKDDVAPWMVNVCLGCHGDNNPRGGFSMMTFEKLLEGGDSGNTIVPGQADESYIHDLVVLQDPMKMPPGQALIKRSNADALTKWIAEGAKFDGVDPKAPLRSLVPTEEEKLAMQLAGMTEEEMRTRREQQALAHWKRVASREETSDFATDSILAIGNVTEARLEQVAGWADGQLAELRNRYNVPADQAIIRGRLIVHVAGSRFDYQEFNQVLLDRSTPPGIYGHTIITESQAEAYVAVQNLEGEVTADTPSMEYLVRDQVSQAFIRRNGTDIPDWLQEGFGAYEANLQKPDAEYVSGLQPKAIAALRTITRADRLFVDGTFGPEDVSAVGYGLVKYLISTGGARSFETMMNAFREGKDPNEAIQAGYGVTAGQMATQIMSSIR